MQKERTDGYLLVNDAAETQRLRSQAELWKAEATRFLAALDIREGAKALDLGCGAMGVLAPLALLVGEGGSVVGFDADATLLDSAREFIGEAGLANVSLVQGDAFRTGLPDGHFDVVHARFLFALLGRPRELLAEMLRVLRLGGIIAIQEPTLSSSPFLRAWAPTAFPPPKPGPRLAPTLCTGAISM